MLPNRIAKSDLVVVNAVKNDKVGALGAMIANIKTRWLILCYAQNDDAHRMCSSPILYSHRNY